MRRTMLLVVLVLSMMVAKPHGAYVATAATGMKAVQCPTWGFTMQIPSAWIVLQSCSSDVAVASTDFTYVLDVISERHGFWNDVRSHSSIHNDLTARAVALPGHTIVSGPAFRAFNAHGYHYYQGTLVSADSRGMKQVLAEYETFFTGYMYKISAAFAVSTDNTVTNARANLIARLVSSTQLYARK